VAAVAGKALFVPVTPGVSPRSGARDPLPLLERGTLWGRTPQDRGRALRGGRERVPGQARRPRDPRALAVGAPAPARPSPRGPADGRTARGTIQAHPYLLDAAPTNHTTMAHSRDSPEP
jgi:hypothetical protein